MSHSLQELTLKNNFMFGAVMSEEKNCKPLLEMILGVSIEKIKVSTERSVVYHPEYKGIRLDVYAKDENNTLYNVEMQAVRKDSLEKRSRYYHSQLDMELLSSGEEYMKLPQVYVIFICDFDPFGDGKFCYHFETRCKENENRRFMDERYTIFLSTKGRDPSEISPKLRNFLEFLGMDLEDSQKESSDSYVRQLQETIRHVKESREMEGWYMRFNLFAYDERKEGKLEYASETILRFLNNLGSVPLEVSERICSERNLDVLNHWLDLCITVSTIEEFQSKMDDAISNVTTI